MMQLSRLGCPLSLKTPNMGNPGLGVNHPNLEPLWDTVAGLGVPIHWFADNKRTLRLEQYLSEIRP